MMVSIIRCLKMLLCWMFRCLEIGQTLFFRFKEESDLCISQNDLKQIKHLVHKISV